LRIGLICEDLGASTTIWKVVIQRVTVIELRIDNGSGSGAGCFEVEIWADTGYSEVHECDSSRI